jgi:cyclomaltodextrinase
VKPGRYRHFKGREYEVIAVAKHSETQEEYVVYRALYGDGDYWVRPKGMFAEKLMVDGKMIPRFEYVGEVPKEGRSNQHPLRSNHILSRTII